MSSPWAQVLSSMHGAGARGSPAQHPVSEDQAEINRRTVAGVILRLCEGMGEQQGEGAKQLALMMVEIISPDIMYNGLPWPEEEFMKVTIERDLSITNLLTRHPITWTLLSITPHLKGWTASEKCRL